MSARVFQPVSWELASLVRKIHVDRRACSPSLRWSLGIGAAAFGRALGLFRAGLVREYYASFGAGAMLVLIGEPVLMLAGSTSPPVPLSVNRELEASMSKATMTWDEGLREAERVIKLLSGTYTRLAVAGSIRRGKAEVGDVELVAAGAVDPITSEKLLESRLNELRGLKEITLQTKSNGTLKAWSDRYRAFEFEGVPVDLFVVQPDREWGPTMVLRTGPGSANECLMVPYAGERGCSPREVMWREGQLWRLPMAIQGRWPGMPLPAGATLIPTPEEADVFKTMDLPWFPPHKRTNAQYNTTAWCRDRGYGGSSAIWWPGWLKATGCVPVTVDEVRDPSGAALWPTVIEPVTMQERVQQMELV